MIYQRYKGKGLLIVTAQVMHLPANATYPVDIPVALIGQGSKDILVVSVIKLVNMTFKLLIHLIPGTWKPCSNIYLLSD